MVEITQNTKRNYANKAYLNLNRLKIKIDTDILDKDLNNLEEVETYNKYDKKNVETLISYMETIKKRLNNENSLELHWGINKETELPELKPIQLIKEPSYNFDICNYISLEPGQYIVDVDVQEIANMIAFEIMHRDFGEDHDSIEELLKDAGVINYNKSEIVTRYLKNNSDRPYELSKSFRIGESTYTDVSGKINDYFYTKMFKGDRYLDVVSYSCRYAASIVADNILRNHCKFDYLNLISISDTNVLVLVHSNEDIGDMVDNIVEPISVRIFGRKFKVSPQISIY